MKVAAACFIIGMKLWVELEKRKYPYILNSYYVKE